MMDTSDNSETCATTGLLGHVAWKVGAIGSRLMPRAYFGGARNLDAGQAHDDRHQSFSHEAPDPSARAMARVGWFEAQRGVVRNAFVHIFRDANEGLA